MIIVPTPKKVRAKSNDWEAGIFMTKFTPERLMWGELYVVFAVGKAKTTELLSDIDKMLSMFLLLHSVYMTFLPDVCYEI